MYIPFNITHEEEIKSVLWGYCEEREGVRKSEVLKNTGITS